MPADQWELYSGGRAGTRTAGTIRRCRSSVDRRLADRLFGLPSDARSLALAPALRRVKPPLLPRSAAARPARAIAARRRLPAARPRESPHTHRGTAHPAQRVAAEPLSGVR